MENFQQDEDADDMKRLLIYFKMNEAMNKLTLTKGTSMKDVKVKSGQLQGFNYVLTELANEYPMCKKFIGRSPEQKALSRQWLQYAILHLRGKSTIPEYILKEMDTSLSCTTFFAGNNVTLADPVLYICLHSTFREMTFYEKEKYTNLSRWFRLMQEDENLRKGNTKLIFSRTPLYNSVNAHA